jgi:hypothetical protein
LNDASSFGATGCTLGEHTNSHVEKPENCAKAQPVF